VPQAM